jgi:hypothetical protein
MRKPASIGCDKIFLLQMVSGTNVYNDFMVFNSNEIKQKATHKNFFKWWDRNFMGQYAV